jgi:hypothetical protein
MNADVAKALVRNITGIVADDLANADPDDWDDDAGLEVWHELDELLSALRIVHRRVGCNLADRLPSEYTHPTVGVVHWDTESNTTWDGNGILNALGKPMVDQQTGEKDVPAVPVATLRKVLPACGPNQTSSKWKKTGLRAAGIRPGNYSRTDYGQRVLRRGPKYRGASIPPDSVDGNR